MLIKLICFIQAKYSFILCEWEEISKEFTVKCIHLDDKFDSYHFSYYFRINPKCPELCELVLVSRDLACAYQLTYGKGNTRILNAFYSIYNQKCPFTARHAQVLRPPHYTKRVC